jgi:hypothetical protein
MMIPFVYDEDPQEDEGRALPLLLDRAPLKSLLTSLYLLLAVTTIVN